MYSSTLEMVALLPDDPTAGTPAPADTFTSIGVPVPDGGYLEDRIAGGRNDEGGRRRGGRVRGRHRDVHLVHRGRCSARERGSRCCPRPRPSPNGSRWSHPPANK